MIFEEKDFNSLKVKEKVDPIEYSEISEFSDFPNSIDKLKTIKLSSTSIAQLGPDLKRYYELLSLYLNKDPKFDLNVEEFKALSTKICKYTLSSEDYNIMRDSLLETQNYLKTITQEELYGENGVYTSLQKTSRDFTTKTNEIVTEINNSYSNFDQGNVGRVIPDGAINETYLSEKLKTDFNYISMTTGMYIDRTVESDITIPEEIKGKALVLKAIGN